MNENFNDLLSNFSEILKEKDIDLNNLMGNNNANSDGDCNGTENRANTDDFFDINMILKIKDIMSHMKNDNNPRNQLLHSLKPYLEDTKKEKLEQYIKIANLLSVLDSFDDKNSFKFLSNSNYDFVLMLILFLLIF